MTRMSTSVLEAVIENWSDCNHWASDWQVTTKSNDLCEVTGSKTGVEILFLFEYFFFDV